MPRCFALVPAAGTGSRLGGDRPKQYRLLAGKPMLWHALDALCASPRIWRVFVVLAETDAHWACHDWSGFGARLAVLRCGGTTRAESVRNGLLAISATVAADDWVLIHDAARPCLTLTLLDRLIDEVAEDAVGGLLAIPLADTLKRATPDRRIAATVPREHLWQAQTPQMFRYGLLCEALTRSHEVSDEAAAVERLGRRPLLVPSDPVNLKVTHPPDLALAERILLERKAT
jgi:2-C-methyl-D-erythritol 4-phosphate cytidylyltransferase